MSNLSVAIEQLATALSALAPFAHTAKEPFTKGYARDVRQECQPETLRPADWRRFTLRCERVAALEIGGLGGTRYEAELMLETRYPGSLGGELVNAYFGAEIEGVRELLETEVRKNGGVLVFGELGSSELLIAQGGVIFAHRLRVYYDHCQNGAFHD